MSVRVLVSGYGVGFSSAPNDHEVAVIVVVQVVSLHEVSERLGS